MRGLTLLHLLLLLSAHAALADVPARRPATEGCSLDSDCVITTFAGCCAPCPSEPRAVSRAGLASMQRRCAAMDCAPVRAQCEAPRDLGPLVPRCEASRCVAVPASPPPPPRPDECRADSDCVLSTFNGCCSVCAGPLHAMRRAELQAAQRRCARVDCAERGPGECRPRLAEPTPLRAACEARRCVEVYPNALPPPPPPPPPPALECRVDQDCAVDFQDPGPQATCHSSPCGCCPGTTPRAVPSRLSPRPPAPPATGATPPFGLSVPKDGQGVACPRCPPRPPAAAGCQAGRCVLVPTALR